MNDTSLTPKQYYYGPFRQDYLGFIKNSHLHEHPGEGAYISWHPDSGAYDDVKPENKQLFFFSLGFTLLIDQIMSCFEAEYPKFKALTMYPKMEYGITWIAVDPWQIIMFLRDKVLFGQYCEYIIADIKDFFEQHKEIGLSWENIKNVIIANAKHANNDYANILLSKVE